MMMDRDSRSPRRSSFQHQTNAYRTVMRTSLLLFLLPAWTMAQNEDPLSGSKLAQCRQDCEVHLAATRDCVKSGGHTDTAEPCITPCEAMKRVMPYPTTWHNCMSKYKTVSYKMCHRECLGPASGWNFAAQCAKARKRRNGIIQYNACSSAVREAFRHVMAFLNPRLKVVNGRYVYLDAHEIAAAEEKESTPKATKAHEQAVWDTAAQQQEASVAAAAQAAAAAAASAEAAKLARAAEAAEAKAAAADALAARAKAAAAAAAKAAADADAAAAAAAAGLSQGGTQRFRGFEGTN